MQYTIREAHKAASGDTVSNVPVEFIAKNWIFLLNAFGIIVVILQEFLRVNVFQFFITDAAVLAMITNWVKGLISILTIILLANQRHLVSLKRG